MKNITYLLLFFISFGYSQTTIDFEPFDSFQLPNTKVFLNKTNDSIIATTNRDIESVHIWSFEGTVFNRKDDYKNYESLNRISIDATQFPIGRYIIIVRVIKEESNNNVTYRDRRWVTTRFTIY